MVQCRECNSEVSDKAKFCPKCRTPLKSNEDTPKSPKIASDKKGGFNPILIVAIIQGRLLFRVSHKMKRGQ